MTHFEIENFPLCLNLVLSCLVGFLAIAMVVHISSSIIIAHFESENFPLCLTLGIILLVSFSSYCHRLFTSVVFIIIEDFERERFPLCLSFVLLSVVCDILLLIPGYACGLHCFCSYCQYLGHVP